MEAVGRFEIPQNALEGASRAWAPGSPTRTRSAGRTWPARTSRIASRPGVRGRVRQLPPAGHQRTSACRRVRAAARAMTVDPALSSARHRQAPQAAHGIVRGHAVLAVGYCVIACPSSGRSARRLRKFMDLAMVRRCPDEAEGGEACRASDCGDHDEGHVDAAGHDLMRYRGDHHGGAWRHPPWTGHDAWATDALAAVIAAAGAGDTPCAASAAGSPALTRLVTTDPSTAVASAPPTFRLVCWMPVATPARAGGAEPTTACDPPVSDSPTPMPISTNQGHKPVSPEPGARVVRPSA